MNGPMERYKASLQDTPGPISLKDCPHAKVDLRGLLAYARSAGVQPADLSDEEKRRFVNIPQSAHLPLMDAV